MRRPRSYSISTQQRVAIVFVCFLLIGILLPVEALSPAVVAQTLPPRPTLTPGDEEDDDDDEAEATPVAPATAIATATVTPTVLHTPTATVIPSTPIPPTPMTLPVTGSRASSGGALWVMLTVGLIAGLLFSGMGHGRAQRFLRRKR